MINASDEDGSISSFEIFANEELISNIFNTLFAAFDINNIRDDQPNNLQSTQKPSQADIIPIKKT